MGTKCTPAAWSNPLGSYLGAALTSKVLHLRSKIPQWCPRIEKWSQMNPKRTQNDFKMIAKISQITRTFKATIHAKPLLSKKRKWSPHIYIHIHIPIYIYIYTYSGQGHRGEKEFAVAQE